VTNDFEAVTRPFGAGCSNIVTWPLRYLAQGKLKVPSAVGTLQIASLKTDEITSRPFEMFQRMVNRWTESFLTTPTWEVVRKKGERSRKAWGEE
jgi:hypothetical protein